MNKIYNGLKMSGSLLGVASMFSLSSLAETESPPLAISTIPYSQPPSVYKIRLRFEARPVLSSELLPGHERLRDTDNALIIPVHTYVRFIFGAADVLHSWYLPSLEAKYDCIPGKTQMATLFFNETGIYYGACAELCGDLHARMPVCIRVVHASDIYT